MKVLLVAPPDAGSSVNYFTEDTDFEICLLWDEDGPGQSAGNIPGVGQVVFWNDFRSPRALLQAVRPDRIVFLEIIDLRQIALIVEARAHGVSTFFLDHGAAGDRATAVRRQDEVRFWRDKVPHFVGRIRRLRSLIKAKAFYYSVRRGAMAPHSRWKYATLPFAMLRQAPLRALAHSLFRERVPDHCIIFSRKNYEQIQLHTGIEESDAILTGVPFFDRFWRSGNTVGDHVVYIDHPYLEDGLLDWTPDHHRRIAELLFRFATERRKKLYVKLHPRSSLDLWKSYNLHSPYFEVIQFGDFDDLYLRSELILGFASSLIVGFICARKNVVCLDWHPAAIRFGPDYASYGLSHRSSDPDDLLAHYDQWVSNNLCATKDDSRYSNFVYWFNDPFDGMAGARVIDAIKRRERVARGAYAQG